jgi:hypothetical protein
MGEKRIKEEKRNAKRFIYIGETNSSVFKRGIEHQESVLIQTNRNNFLMNNKAEYNRCAF